MNARRVAGWPLRIGLAAWAIGGVACGEDGAPDGPTESDSLKATRVMTDLRLVDSSLGQPKFILEADEAVQHGDDRVVELTNMRITFFSADGTTSSVLTAREGEVDRKTRQLIARQNVRVVTPEQYSLETEVLEWDNARQKILSDAAVRITEGRNVTTGVGLVSTPDLEHFEIKRDVRVHVVDEEVESSHGGGTERSP